MLHIYIEREFLMLAAGPAILLALVELHLERRDLLLERAELELVLVDAARVCRRRGRGRAPVVAALLGVDAVPGAAVHLDALAARDHAPARARARREVELVAALRVGLGEGLALVERVPILRRAELLPIGAPRARAEGTELGERPLTGSGRGRGVGGGGGGGGLGRGLGGGLG